MTGPSPHLSWDELACHDADHTPYPSRWRTSRAKQLGEVFEDLRRTVDRPLRILSGYRTVAHQRRVNPGVVHSQHVQGRALDLATPRGWTRISFHAAIRAWVKTDLRIGGIGYYRWGVHVDIRPRHAGRLAAWNGRGGAVRA